MKKAYMPIGIAGVLAALMTLGALVWGMLRCQKQRRVKQRSRDAMRFVGSMLLAASGDYQN